MIPWIDNALSFPMQEQREMEVHLSVVSVSFPKLWKAVLATEKLIGSHISIFTVFC